MRIGFNAGDEASWPADLPYERYLEPIQSWPLALEKYLERHAISDIVIYGDTRPIHAAARRIAEKRGLRLHAFEEGYLRPYWVTYERGGTNGHSRLMEMSLNAMRIVLDGQTAEPVLAPPVWGTLWRHTWHGCLYHANILFRNQHYPNYQTHRAVSVAKEWWLQCKRLAAMPMHVMASKLSARQLLRSGSSYHLVLLQLSHDSAFVGHSDFVSMRDFMETCAKNFASGAGPSELLVFKAHPFEDGREKLPSIARALAQDHGLTGRLKFIYGGNLGLLLDNAKSVVTINSTAGQQALARGIPLKIMGRAVYGKPELVSSQEQDQFFRKPTPPEDHSYREFRSYLIATSQITGSYYSSLGRARLVRHVIPMLLAERDPYDEFAGKRAAGFGQMRLIAGTAGQL